MWLHKETDFAETRLRLVAEGFAVKPCEVAGDKCWLIFPPNMGVEWNEDNMIYRSGIWTDSGEPVSLSWKKFFNWDEKCELAPKPENIEDCTLVNKEDGSTLLVSIYKGELVMRTRGTVDMTTLQNGYEKEQLIKKYYSFFRDFMNVSDTSNCTYVFEWETPNNKIVIDYGDEPRLVLTGIIEHYDYGYMLNDTVDAIACLHELERAPTFKFDDFDSMQAAMKSMKGIEGICVYFNADQDIKKMKTDEYLMLHSVKFKLGYKALIDMVYEENMRLDDFKAYIEKKFDHEGLTFVEDMIDEIYMNDKFIKSVIAFFYINLIDNYHVQSAKELAAAIFENHNPAYKRYSGFLFKLYAHEIKDTGLRLNDVIVALRELFMANESLCRKFKNLILEELK